MVREGFQVTHRTLKNSHNLYLNAFQSQCYTTISLWIFFKSFLSLHFFQTISVLTLEKCKDRNDLKKYVTILLRNNDNVVYNKYSTVPKKCI